MQTELQTHVVFHLTGMRPAGELDAVDALDLPALLARYRDLTALRYDFPVVLVGNGAAETCVQSLSGIVDRVLSETAPPGKGGERLRKHLLRLEREIRTQAAAGVGGSLLTLWDLAARRLGSATNEMLEDNLSRARLALKVDGDVLDCNAALPVRLLTHLWKTVQERKARKFREHVNRLILKLSDILTAAYVHSQAGQSATSLEAAVGAGHADMFDFDIMSHLLARALPQKALPENRRRRIDRALTVLKSQRFFPIPNGRNALDDDAAAYAFVFESCADALAAFRARLPEMIEVAEAMAIAELEIEGRYDDVKHDAFFEEFGANMFGPQDRAAFPDYLVRVRAENKVPSVEQGMLMEVLATGLPIKVLLQTDDILEASALDAGHPAGGVRGTQLARMAIGLNDVYVLQSSSSNLVQCRDRIVEGMTYPGSALFSVYSGAGGAAGGLPPYLVAAAAMQSRAFPAFTYDPSAGSEWASRFSLEDNPQVDRDWPMQSFAYEDEAHQRVTEDIAFTFIEFAACDRRYAPHFARVPRAKCNGGMFPVGAALASQPTGLPEKVPYVLMVDRDNLLHKVIVDDKLLQGSRRCAETWRSLQELGGIHNSHAERLLARAKQAWEEERQRDVEVRQPEPKPAAAATAALIATDAAPVQAEPEPERSSDEPYIETPRCTSCDECTQINNRMFAYDANKQAHIADLSAGTYRQLVEAAESCQVSIIHPGKPRNPNEPGLEELRKRAEPFL